MSAGRHLDDVVLSALVDGELTDEDALVAGAHHAVCEVCRARAAMFGRVSSLVSVLAVSPGPSDLIAGEQRGADDFGRILAAALAEVGMGVRPLRRRAARRRALRAAASVAAGLAAVAIIFGAFGHQRPAGFSSGLAASLGTFTDTRQLSATLATEIASLAPNPSAPVLPCHTKAAASAARPPASRPAFSAPLVYSGAKAQVFAYESSATSPTRVAVVLSDRDCTVLAYLSW